MKKILLLLVILYILVSCNSFQENKVGDVKKVRVGMSVNELKYILHEPYYISVDNGHDEYYFRYESGETAMSGLHKTFMVYIVKDTVNDFISY